MIMSKLYKGFIETKGKASIEKLKNRTTWKTYDEVKNLNGFGGVLADDTILIDIDDSDQSEILMDIVEELQLDCKVLCTSRGKHFLFKNRTIARNRTHVQLAVGLTADIKVGSKLSYEVIKIDGEERFCEWDIEEGGQYQEVPKWLFPVKARNLQILREKIGVEQFRVIAELLNQEHLTFGDYTRGGFISKEEQRAAIMKDFYHGYSWNDLERKYGLTPSALYKITEKKT